MCPKTPKIPEPEEFEKEDEELVIDDNDDEQKARSRRRGTQSLQIGLATPRGRSGLSV